MILLCIICVTYLVYCVRYMQVVHRGRDIWLIVTTIHLSGYLLHLLKSSSTSLALPRIKCPCLFSDSDVLTEVFNVGCA
jgi:hypothetical protein